MDTSAHLCQTMGLPIREWVEPGDVGGAAGKVPSELDDLSRASQSQSPGETGNRHTNSRYVCYISKVKCV